MYACVAALPSAEDARTTSATPDGVVERGVFAERGALQLSSTTSTSTAAVSNSSEQPSDEPACRKRRRGGQGGTRHSQASAQTKKKHILPTSRGTPTAVPLLRPGRLCALGRPGPACLGQAGAGPFDSSLRISCAQAASTPPRSAHVSASDAACSKEAPAQAGGPAMAAPSARLAKLLHNLPALPPGASMAPRAGHLDCLGIPPPPRVRTSRAKHLTRNILSRPPQDCACVPG